MNKESALIGTLGYGKEEPYKNTSLTTPNCIELHQIINDLIEQNIEYIALEASSHGLSQNRLSGINISTAAFTNLTHDHLDYHKDLKEYENSKLMLFNDIDIKKAVINIDNPFGKRISENIPKSIDKLDVSLEGSTKSKPVINGTIKQHDSNGLIIDVESDFGKGQIKSPLTGRFNAQNLLLSLGILLSEGFQLDNIINAFQFITLPPGRMQSINGFGEQKIIIDYAHTPDGLEHSLRTIKEIYHGKVCVVFGCGGDRDNKKRPLMGSMAEKYADEIIITDDNPRTESSKNIINDILNGIHDKKRTQTISDRHEAILYALKASSYNDIVLISGKGHEEKQIYRTKEYDFSDRRCVEEILKIK